MKRVKVFRYLLKLQKRKHHGQIMKKKHACKVREFFSNIFLLALDHFPQVSHPLKILESSKKLENLKVDPKIVKSHENS